MGVGVSVAGGGRWGSTRTLGPWQGGCGSGPGDRVGAGGWVSGGAGRAAVAGRLPRRGVGSQGTPGAGRGVAGGLESPPVASAARWPVGGLGGWSAGAAAGGRGRTPKGEGAGGARQLVARTLRRGDLFLGLASWCVGLGRAATRP